ncbi:MAG: dTDP-4-dehydrorhamnose 3,5-epimerase [Solirubrobacterales bacterium]
MSEQRCRRLETRLDGLVLVEPTSFGDDRGFFLETYRRDEYAKLGIDVEFVQDNHSRSGRGAVRGLHFQIAPGQAKLVRTARGAIYDVALDLRKDSATFGEWEAVALTDDNHRQLFVPAGFAHGFCVTSEIADVTYKVSNYYDSATERGIAFDDPALAIPWPADDPVVSSRDRSNPTFEQMAPGLRW